MVTPDVGDGIPGTHRNANLNGELRLNETPCLLSGEQAEEANT